MLTITTGMRAIQESRASAPSNPKATNTVKTAQKVGLLADTVLFVAGGTVVGILTLLASHYGALSFLSPVGTIGGSALIGSAAVVLLVDIIILVHAYNKKVNQLKNLPAETVREEVRVEVEKRVEVPAKLTDEQAQILAAHPNFKDLEQQISAKKQELQGIADQIGLKSTELGELQKSLEAKQKEVQAAQEHLQHLTDAAAEKQNELDLKIAAFNNPDLNDAKTALEALKNQQNELKAEIEKGQEKLNAAQEAEQLVRTKLDEATKQLEVKEKEHIAAQKKLEEVHAARQIVIAKIEETMIEFNAKQEELKQLQDATKEQEELKQKTIEALNSLEKQIEQKKQELAALGTQPPSTFGIPDAPPIINASTSKPEESNPPETRPPARTDLLAEIQKGTTLKKPIIDRKSPPPADDQKKPPSTDKSSLSNVGAVIQQSDLLNAATDKLRKAEEEKKKVPLIPPNILGQVESEAAASTHFRRNYSQAAHHFTEELQEKIDKLDKAIIEETEKLGTSLTSSWSDNDNRDLGTSLIAPPAQSGTLKPYFTLLAQWVTEGEDINERKERAQKAITAIASQLDEVWRKAVEKQKAKEMENENFASLEPQQQDQQIAAQKQRIEELSTFKALDGEKKLETITFPQNLTMMSAQVCNKLKWTSEEFILFKAQVENLQNSKTYLLEQLEQKVFINSETFNKFDSESNVVLAKLKEIDSALPQVSGKLFSGNSPASSGRSSTTSTPASTSPVLSSKTDEEDKRKKNLNNALAVQIQDKQFSIWDVNFDLVESKNFMKRNVSSVKQQILPLLEKAKKAHGELKLAAKDYLTCEKGEANTKMRAIREAHNTVKNFIDIVITATASDPEKITPEELLAPKPV